MAMTILLGAFLMSFLPGVWEPHNEVPDEWVRWHNRLSRKTWIGWWEHEVDAPWVAEARYHHVHSLEDFVRSTHEWFPHLSISQKELIYRKIHESKESPILRIAGPPLLRDSSRCYNIEITAEKTEKKEYIKVNHKSIYQQVHNRSKLKIVVNGYSNKAWFSKEAISYARLHWRHLLHRSNSYPIFTPISTCITGLCSNLYRDTGLLRFTQMSNNTRSSIIITEDILLFEEINNTPINEAEGGIQLIQLQCCGPCSLNVNMDIRRKNDHLSWFFLSDDKNFLEYLQCKKNEGLPCFLGPCGIS